MGSAILSAHKAIHFPPYHGLFLLCGVPGQFLPQNVQGEEMQHIAALTAFRAFPCPHFFVKVQMPLLLAAKWAIQIVFSRILQTKAVQHL